jgi:bacterial/archaeal transporter family protein
LEGAVTAGWIVPTLIYVISTGLLGVLTKLALRDRAWQELILWTGLGYIVLVIVLLATGQTSVQFVSGSWWAVLSAALAIVSLFTLFTALNSGQAGKVVPVSASYPAVTVVAASIFLSEQLTIVRAAGVLVVVAGVVVLTTAR